MSEDISTTEKLYALAHEAGHIFCGHLKDGNMNCSIEEEYEANEFAHAILHRRMRSCIVQWIREHKKTVCAGAFALLVACVAVIGIVYNACQRSYYGEYYITENGEKYHKIDCIFVKDKSNVKRLTEKDYYSGEYDPCQNMFTRKKLKENKEKGETDHVMTAIFTAIGAVCTIIAITAKSTVAKWIWEISAADVFIFTIYAIIGAIAKNKRKPKNLADLRIRYIEQKSKKSGFKKDCPKEWKSMQIEETCFSIVGNRKMKILDIVSLN